MPGAAGGGHHPHVKTATRCTRSAPPRTARACAALAAAACLAAPSASASNYVRLSDSGRYFQLEDGADFVPIGQNEGVDWPYLANLYPRGRQYAPETTRDYFSTLHDSGVNVIRIMTEAPAALLNPGGIQMEDPVGTFDPNMIDFLDLLFELAADYRIYLMITPYDTFWMNNVWDQSPYNPDLGGPVHAKEDFLTTDACFQYQKERWKFLIDRYGSSDFVFAWDILNEFDIWWGSNEEEELAWVDRMTSFIRRYERERWGKNHLVCTSTAAADPSTGGALNYAVYRHPNVDFPTTHMYYGRVNDPPDAIAPALAVNAGMRRQLAQVPASDPRPYLDSESGPIDNWPLPRAFDEEVFHNMIWAHLASGGAGSGLRWPYRNDPHTLTLTMHEYQRAMSRVARAIQWSTFASRNIDGELTLANTGDHAAVAMGCGDGRTALVWVAQDTRATSGTIAGAVLSVAGMPSSTYEVLFFDTRTGDERGGTTTAPTGDVVSAPLPAFEQDIAAIFRDPAGTPARNRKPEGEITSPAPDTAVSSGTVTLTAEAEDDDGPPQVAFFACFDDGAGAGVNLLPNASFETGREATPADWSPYVWAGAPGFAWDTQGHTGARSVKIGAASGSDASWWTTVRVEPNTDYRISGWIRTENVVPLGGGAGAVLDAHGLTGTTTPVLTGSHDWTRVETVINSGSRTVLQINATLGGGGRARGAAWFDDVVLAPVANVRTWRLVGIDAEPPYAMDWDVSTLPDQVVDVAIGLADDQGHMIQRAREARGISLQRESGDRTRPFGSLVFPGTNTAIPAAPIALEAHAWDLASVVTRVQFWIQGTPSNPSSPVNTLLGEVFGSPYELAVDLTSYAGTTRWISLDVFDAAGNALRPADLHTGIAIGDDTIPPTARFTEPRSGVTISSLPLVLRADAHDVGSGVARVVFSAYYNGAWHNEGEDPSAPYAVAWDRNILNQRVAFSVEAIDNAGNASGTADIVGGLDYQVNGDTTPPWCHIVEPTSGSAVEVPFELKAIADDALSGVREVAFRWWDGAKWRPIGAVDTPPYTFLWKGFDVAGGSVVVIAVDATDHAGNTRSAADAVRDIRIIAPDRQSVIEVY